MNSSPHIYDHVSEYVDISGHIDFAEELIKKYEWDDQVQNRLLSQLRLIRAKQNDKCLNLSVIGEFSAGKSSFINALLGEELLVSSVIQGTTVVNTIIEYYSKPALYIQKKDGTYEYIHAQSIKDLSNRLSDVTTNPNTAKTIQEVRVGIPSKLLASGLRIIDTPGTNSTESWHEDVTKNALRNLSDLSIILTDAIHPLPQTLLNFVYDNIAPILNQCAFVVTYFDKIPKRERTDTLHYIKRKLSSELEIDDPKVFPYIAPAVLASNAGKTIMPEQDEMVKICSDSYSALIDLTWKNRQISQIKKLLSLTKEAFSILEQSIEQQRVQHQQEYQLLLKSKQISLEPFIQSEKRSCSDTVRLKAADIKDRLIATIASRSKTAKSTILRSIMTSNCTNADQLKDFITTQVPKICDSQARFVAQSLELISSALYTTFKQAMAEYQRHFEQQFQKLGILRINLNNLTIDRPKVQSVSLQSLKSSIDYISEEVSKENWAMGGGGVAGAAIGTAIMPGIGTVVGGILGLMVGAMNTPPVEELKKNACEKISGSLYSVFQTIERDLINVFNNNVNTYISTIHKEIDRYLQAYKSIVDKRIAEHNALIKNNQQQTARIETDLKLITLRQKQLKSISETLH